MYYKTTTFYNYFSRIYPLVDFFLRPQKKQLYQQINKLPKGKLLEVGIGTGIHLQFYKPHEITGIDNSPEMIKRAKLKNNESIKIITMDGENLLFSDAIFDYVVLAHVLSVVEHPDKLLIEVFRVLKPQGKLFILNHFTPNNPLKYLDFCFHKLAKLCCFQSKFSLYHIKTIKKFSLESEISLDYFNYFKLLCYRRP